MREKMLMTPRLPENDSCSPRGEATQELGKVIGALESIRRKVEESREEKKVAAADLHREAAPIAAVVLDGFGKDMAASSCLGKTFQEVSDIRHGRRGMALWELTRLLSESPEAFLALSRVFCERHQLQPPQPVQRITREQAVDDLIEWLLQSPPLLKLLAGFVAMKRGVREEEVIAALGSK